MLELYNIKDSINDLDEVIDLIYDEWGKFLKKTKEERIEKIKNAIENNLKSPQVFVMKNKNEVIGTFTIKEEELESFGKVSSVWYLLIKKEFRGKGFGKELLKFLKNICSTFSEIYLLTEHIGFYEKIGFEFIKQINHNGQIQRLYIKA